MKTEKIAENYTAHTHRWLNELRHFTNESFVRSAPGEWSAAQVADHICRTTHKCLDMAEQCCDGRGEKGHAALGPALFSFMGAFPPVKLRIKNPPEAVAAVYAPEQLTLDAAAAKLQEAEARMRAVLSKIKTADPAFRAKHWAGGWFNAAQWYQNAEMHIKHHFRQLKRIKKQLAING